jgi:hypothetical protein
MQIVPHPRTLRKARMQVQLMVQTGSSARQIRSYLNRFIYWWANTSEIWKYEELIMQLLATCWDIKTAAYPAGLLLKRLTQFGSFNFYNLIPAAVSVMVVAGQAAA